MKTIRINPLSQTSVNDAILQIEALQAKLKKLEEFDKYLQTLANAGVAIAQANFDRGAVYKAWNKKNKEHPTVEYVDNYVGVTVKSKPIPNGFVIEADGEQVLFMEFGAGVYHSGQAYEGNRADFAGIVGIGEYDKHNGTRRTWGWYPNEDDKTFVMLTHGVPALNGMYRAKRHILIEVEKKLKELLND